MKKTISQTTPILQALAHYYNLPLNSVKVLTAYRYSQAKICSGLSSIVGIDFEMSNSTSELKQQILN